MMSNQEMQFNDPERRSHEQHNANIEPPQQDAYSPRPINIDPREQAQWQAGPPPSQEAGYMEQRPYLGPQPEKIGVGPYSRQRNRRRSPWFWIILVLIILAILGAGSGSAFRGFGVHNRVVEGQNFTIVGQHPTIVINNDVGQIHVNSGSANGGVHIDAVKQGNGFLSDPNNIRVNFKQNGDTITSTVDEGRGSFNSGRVDFEVTVPTNADLQLRTNSGDIDVSNVNGQMSLVTDNGSITATQDTLTGQATLATHSGDISLIQDTFNGPSTLSTDSGSIDATQEILNSSSTLKTDSGSVTFSGSIASSGTYQVQTDSGSVDVTLPNSPAFHVDASTDSGSIDSEYPEVNVQQNDSGASAHGNVGGTTTNATVTIKTGSGSINLHKPS